SEKLAREAVVRAGGRIESEGGAETLLIPHTKAAPMPLEQSWAPGPVAGSTYTSQELAEQIRPDELSNGRPDMAQIVGEFAPGWHVEDCGLEMDPGLRAEYRGR